MVNPRWKRVVGVRFGSKADIGAPPIDVRFTPKSRHKSWPRLRLAQLRQLRHVGRNPSRLVFGHAEARAAFERSLRANCRWQQMIMAQNV
jgi:hypothetical protein